MEVEHSYDEDDREAERTVTEIRTSAWTVGTNTRRDIISQHYDITNTGFWHLHAVRLLWLHWLLLSSKKVLLFFFLNIYNSTRLFFSFKSLKYSIKFTEIRKINTCLSKYKERDHDRSDHRLAEEFFSINTLIKTLQTTGRKHHFEHICLKIQSSPSHCQKTKENTKMTSLWSALIQQQ